MLKKLSWLFVSAYQIAKAQRPLPCNDYATEAPGGRCSNLGAGSMCTNFYEAPGGYNGVFCSSAPSPVPDNSYCVAGDNECVTTPDDCWGAEAPGGLCENIPQSSYNSSCNGYYGKHAGGFYQCQFVKIGPTFCETDLTQICSVRSIFRKPVIKGSSSENLDKKIPLLGR